MFICSGLHTEGRGRHKQNDIVTWTGGVTKAQETEQNENVVGRLGTVAGLTPTSHLFQHLLWLVHLSHTVKQMILFFLATASGLHWGGGGGGGGGGAVSTHTHTHTHTYTRVCIYIFRQAD